MKPTPNIAAIKVAPKKVATKKSPAAAALKRVQAAADAAAAAPPAKKLPAKKVTAGPKKSLPAKAAVKAAAKAQAQPTKVATPKQPDLTDEEWMAQQNAMLETMGLQLHNLRQSWHQLSASGQEAYAGKGEDKTQYEQVEAKMYSLEDEISRRLGIPADYWDLDDQGNIGWDEDALDDPTLFDEDGEPLLDDDGSSLVTGD